MTVETNEWKKRDKSKGISGKGKIKKLNGWTWKTNCVLHLQVCRRKH